MPIFGSVVSFYSTLDPYSALKHLSFEVLHDHICQNLDFTYFWGAHVLRGLEKGVRGYKKNGHAKFLRFIGHKGPPNQKSENECKNLANIFLVIIKVKQIFNINFMFFQWMSCIENSIFLWEISLSVKAKHIRVKWMTSMNKLTLKTYSLTLIL